MNVNRRNGNDDSQDQGHHEDDEDEDADNDNRKGQPTEPGDFLSSNSAISIINHTNCEEVVEGKLNPIFIPSIINHIVSFFSCRDLKRCRFLNRQWNEECSKHLRQRGLVQLTSKSVLKKFISEFQTNPQFCKNFYFEMLNGIDAPTKTFLNVFGSNVKYLKLDFSTKGYQLSANDFYELIFNHLSNLQELSLVGRISEDDHFLPERIRGVNFNNNREPSTSLLSSFSSSNSNNNNHHELNGTSQSIVPAPPTLPSLQNLELFLYNTSGKSISKHEFLIELLSCVPNLKKISVPKVPRMLTFGMPLLHTLLTTDHLQFNKLEHLDMDIALYNGSIDIIKSKGYPLKVLNAEVNSMVLDESLHDLLAMYGNTLQTLQLKFPRSPVASSDFISASSFQVLRHLSLQWYNGSLKFLEQLGSLLSLELIDYNFTIAMSREDLAQPLKAQFNYKMIWTDFTEEPYCFDCFNSSDAQLLRIFSRNFLNLGCLTLPHLNDTDLRIIYSNFSHSLQELTMENSLFSDSGLTGISLEFLPNLEKSGKEEVNRTHPFIGNLTRLQRLEILTPRNDMTDYSIKYGIVYCENLKTCIIRNAQITDDGLKTLVDSMYLEHLETTMCANIRGCGVKYALEKMTKREMTYLWNKYQSRLTTCCFNRLINGNGSVTCIAPTP